MKKIILLVLSLLLFACSNVDIYSGLDEDQANIMLSTLLKNGIDAKKASAGKAGYSVNVPEKQIVQALEILKDNSLPKDKYDSLGTVFSGQSMIASTSEEKSRFTYAISQELSDTFSRIDGVLNAKVHIVLAEIDTVNNKTTEASAAVFLRHIPDSTVVNLVPKIKELVSSSVADLKYENVSVMLVPSRDSVTVPVIPVKTDSTNIIYQILLLIIGGIFFNLIYILGKTIYNKRKNK